MTILAISLTTQSFYIYLMENNLKELLDPDFYSEINSTENHFYCHNKKKKQRSLSL
jgi:hypothetical protein